LHDPSESLLADHPVALLRASVEHLGGVPRVLFRQATLRRHGDRHRLASHRIKDTEALGIWSDGVALGHEPIMPRSAFSA
jgi:hypothetical protein